MDAWVTDGANMVLVATGCAPVWVVRKRYACSTIRKVSRGGTAPDDGAKP